MTTPSSPGLEAQEPATPETDAIALRLTGVRGLFCDDKSLAQYNDLLRLARALERRLAEAERQRDEARNELQLARETGAKLYGQLSDTQDELSSSHAARVADARRLDWLEQNYYLAQWAFTTPRISSGAPLRDRIDEAMALTARPSDAEGGETR